MIIISLIIKSYSSNVNKGYKNCYIGTKLCYFSKNLCCMNEKMYACYKLEQVPRHSTQTSVAFSRPWNTNTDPCWITLRHCNIISCLVAILYDNINICYFFNPQSQSVSNLYYFPMVAIFSVRLLFGYGLSFIKVYRAWNI